MMVEYGRRERKRRERSRSNMGEVVEVMIYGCYRAPEELNGPRLSCQSIRVLFVSILHILHVSTLGVSDSHADL